MKCIALYFSLLLPDSHFCHAPRFPFLERAGFCFVFSCEEEFWSSTEFSMDYFAVFAARASHRGSVSLLLFALLQRYPRLSNGPAKQPSPVLTAAELKLSISLKSTLSNTKPWSLRGTNRHHFWLWSFCELCGRSCLLGICSVWDLRMYWCLFFSPLDCFILSIKMFFSFTDFYALCKW